MLIKEPKFQKSTQGWEDEFPPPQQQDKKTEMSNSKEKEIRQSIQEFQYM